MLRVLQIATAIAATPVGQFAPRILTPEMQNKIRETNQVTRELREMGVTISIVQFLDQTITLERLVHVSLGKVMDILEDRTWREIDGKGVCIGRWPGTQVRVTWTEQMP